MACSAVRSPILRNSSVRNYAALAKAAQSCPQATTESQKLSNKVIVAALDNNSPITQVSIVFKAGTREETYDTQGINHLLRLAAGLTTSRASTFGITRNIQQLGGNLFATSDRESLTYTLQCTRNHLDQAFSYLEDVATRQIFFPWEVEDLVPRQRIELASIPGNARIIELLHKAAYRTGLGYSLYSPKRQVGNISSETLQHFVSTYFTGSRCAVVGTGVSLGQMVAFGNNLNVNSGDSTSTPSKFKGGESRKERNSDLATVALAVESTGFDKEKDAMAFAVLQYAAGSGPYVKWGETHAPLQTKISSAAGNVPYGATAINCTYSDSGIFGVILQSPPNIAGAITKAAAEWMSSPNITDADVARGKAALKVSILDVGDSPPHQIENLAQQTLFKGRPISCAALAAEVDKVTAADVKAAAGKLKGKLAMAALGDLSTVPYLDELR